MFEVVRSCMKHVDNLALLQQVINFRTDDGNFGINLYNDTVAEVT